MEELNKMTTTDLEYPHNMIQDGRVKEPAFV